MTTATIQDVAERANVSVSTVSRSFTRPDLVSNRTRERVIAIANELNFSISRSAAALKSGKSMRIALLISDSLHQWFNASVIEGLNDVFHAQGYDMSIFQISSIDERKAFFEMLPTRRNADAVIVVSFNIDDTEIEQLRTTGVPIIGINCVDPQNTGFTAAVNIDDAQGSRLTSRHLLTLGHRNIAYIYTDRDISLHFSVEQRFESFMESCREQGIEPAAICAKEGADRISSVMTELLSLPTMPTAIACQEDGIAVPLLFQLNRNGLSAPGDVSILGYDDSFYAHDVALTTVRQDAQAMARLAAQKTLDLINTGTTEELFTTVPAQLIVRATTGRVKHR